ncbi:MAG: MFS transporter [Micropruina sp.]|uniref:MFS transporter n=1 Tax=Micropruina sp. TaxID=2737536 RepID=UPI0039E603BE
MAFYLDAAMLISVAIALPVWRDHFALGPWEVGILGSGLAYAVAIGALIGGRLGDRFGRLRVLTVDLLVFAIGAVLIVLAPSPGVLVAGVVVVGLAAGADVPTALAVISDAAPDHGRGRLAALTQVLWIAGVLFTYGLGFAVSGLGFAGTQVLTLHLVAVAMVTLMLRLAVGSRMPSPDPVRSVGARRLGLARSAVLLPLLATGAFYLCWNAAATTLGSFGTYFLVTITGLTQSQATGLVLVSFAPSLAIALAFVRLADSRWRDRLFVVAALLQIAAYAAGASSGGTAVWSMVVLVLLYSLSNAFAGEAIYKVWSLLLLPAEVRSTAVGLTYAVARVAAAAFLLVVPVIAEVDAALLLWVLAGSVTLSGLVGLFIIRHAAWRRRLNPQSRAR